MDPDAFWEKELLRASDDLLFSCFIDDPKGATALQHFVKGQSTSFDLFFNG